MNLRSAAITGIATGLLGSVLAFTDFGWRLEQDIGLRWLYLARGAREPPTQAVVLAVDHRSSRLLGLPRSPLQWPRSLHACLIDRLTRAGTSVVVFDIHFATRPAPIETDATPGANRTMHPEVAECLRARLSGDAALSQSVRKAGMVVLLRQLTDTPEHPPDDSGRSLDGERQFAEYGALPLQLAEAAAGLAPWPLPVQPARVDEYWAFRTAIDATLPMVALQVYGREQLESLLSMFERTRISGVENLPRPSPGPSNLASFMGAVRSTLRANPSVARHMLEGLDVDVGQSKYSDTILPALVHAYSENGAHYLNFYGPPGTVRTISYGEAFVELGREESELARDLAGKAIFIGASEIFGPQSMDGFFTVFRTKDGADLSGVEIAATAFSNLLARVSIKPPTRFANLALLFLCGFVLGSFATLFSALRAAGAVVVFCTAYFGLAAALFSIADTWLPVFLPLAVQMPIALILGSALQYVSARRAVRLYVPEHVVQRLVSEGNRLGDAEVVYGTCMSTDIAGFTTLSEGMQPNKLADLLNEYFAVVGEPIQQHDGNILGIEGDGSTSVWSSTHSTSDVRRKACNAAIEILNAVEQFNVGHAATLLPTRIGLHSGWFALGNIGSNKHLAYSIIGDIVNTASRIQELNKHLGTRLLASQETEEGLDELLKRPMGQFRLVGKSDVLAISEVRGWRADCAAETEELFRLFEAAVGHYKSKRWREAGLAFAEISAQFPTDGPTNFYLKRCEEMCTSPTPESKSAVIEMKSK